MKYNLFVYGTLMWEETQRALLGRSPQTVDALLYDYRRLKIRRESYPGIKKSPGYSVNGKLLLGLTEEELRVLDQYEGEEYERIEVRVKTPEGEFIDAFVYVIKDEFSDILKDEEWNEKGY
jgi:gamma-glutamylcyclotransferase (GGCT)/AIG2-like uncharacterized protein YtfP